MFLLKILQNNWTHNWLIWPIKEKPVDIPVNNTPKDDDPAMAGLVINIEDFKDAKA